MSDTGQPRILVVDDEPVMRTIAASVLGQHRFDVATAVSAEEAFDWIGAGHLPDLILLDVLMPGMNGFDACRALRRNPRLEHLPIIMLTALDDQASIDEAYRCGATDFITKPLNIPLLPHRMRYLLRSAQAFGDLVRSQSALINTQQIARLGNWSMDAGDTVVSASREFLEIVGAPTTPVPAAQLLERVHGEDRIPLARRRAELLSGRSYQIDYRLRSRNDPRVWTHVHERGFPRMDEAGRYLGAEGFTQDISERVGQEERIRDLAWHDPVTGLNNRARLIELLERDLGNGAARHTLTVLFGHVANLRALSTVMGHALADAAARVLAGRLKSLLAQTVREAAPALPDAGLLIAAKLARYDEDSFVVAFPGSSLEDHVHEFAQRMHETLGKPMLLQGEEIVLNPFVGVASLPDDPIEAAELLRRAMLIALRAASSGRGDISYFDPAHDQEASRRLQFERGLRVALERGNQLMPYFQPKIHARTGGIVGAEVLLRWQHPVLGMISPAEFIPVAEESGLIHPISEWLIGRVCELIADWRVAGTQPGIVSINLSAESFFQPALSGIIDTAIERTGISPRQLAIELTESVLMQNAETARQVIAGLRARGLRVSLDDFGTGFSSLGYLNSFEIDEIKIDRSFIIKLGANDKKMALVQAIVSLGHALNLEVVAEGVETVGQADRLRQMGCDIFQGFLFARPMPAEEFGALCLAPESAERFVEGFR
jgi:diguanylate cyclase (GGDEF)-like protein